MAPKQKRKQKFRVTESCHTFLKFMPRGMGLFILKGGGFGTGGYSQRIAPGATVLRTVNSIIPKVKTKMLDLGDIFERNMEPEKVEVLRHWPCMWPILVQILEPQNLILWPPPGVSHEHRTSNDFMITTVCAANLTDSSLEELEVQMGWNMPGLICSAT